MTIPKRYSAFIQTDKPVYKPGDIVKFRVLVINFESKPYAIEKMEIEMLDGNGDFVKKFDEDEEEKFSTGVYVNEVELATEPVIGKWEIRVVINDEKDLITKLNFIVKEYVLPRFEVNVDTNRDVAQNENVVKLTISANYTFGEFVKGKAVITARIYDTGYPNIVQQTTSKTIDVEFRRLVEFNIRNDLKIVNAIRPYEVRFEVVFEETLTGQKFTKNVSVRIHKTGDFYLEFVQTQKRFKPGYPYEFQVIVRKYDGALATDKYSPVSLKVDFFYKPLLCTPKSQLSSSITRYEANRNIFLKNGIADVKIEVPANTTAVMVSATFHDTKASLNITRHVSNSREYLIVKKITSK